MIHATRSSRSTSYPSRRVAPAVSVPFVASGPSLWLLAAFAAAAGVLIATGAGATSASTETRELRREWSVTSSAETFRIANLAGQVEIVQGAGPRILVLATIHAEGANADETTRLLSGMEWVESKDRRGRPEWALSYPVDRFSGFSYARKGSGWWEDGRSTLEYMGRRVSVHGRSRSGVPILFADLRVELPVGSNVAVRNGVGFVRGGRLQGALVVDTASGDVEITSCAGALTVDTGSGDIDLGEVRGDLVADTGSGSVRVGRLLGTKGAIDTGSGDVEVRHFEGDELTIDTGSGHVRLSGGTMRLLDIDTGSGNIRVEDVEVVNFVGDTGSGDVILRSSLATTRDISVDTGSGSVKFLAGPGASFDIEADQGSGDLVVGYDDATYKRRGREIYGARRGDGQTKIRVETGSGDCIIQPVG